MMHIFKIVLFLSLALNNLGSVEKNSCTFVEVVDGSRVVLQVDGVRETVQLLYVNLYQDSAGKQNPYTKVLTSSYFNKITKPIDIKIWGPGKEFQRNDKNELMALIYAGYKHKLTLMQGDKVVGEKEEFYWISVARMLVYNGLSAFEHNGQKIPVTVRNGFIEAQATAVKNKSGLWTTHPEWIQQRVDQQGEFDESPDEIILTEDLSFLGDKLSVAYVELLEERRDLVFQTMKTLQKSFKPYQVLLEKEARKAPSEELGVTLEWMVKQELMCLSAAAFVEVEDLNYFDEKELGVAVKARQKYLRSKAKAIEKVQGKMDSITEKFVKKVDKEISKRVKKDPDHATKLKQFRSGLDALKTCSDIIGHPNLLKTNREMYGTYKLHQCEFTSDENVTDITDMFLEFVRYGKIDGMTYESLAKLHPELKTKNLKKTFDRFEIWFQYDKGDDDDMMLEFHFDHFDRFHSIDQLMQILRNLVAYSKKDPEYEGGYVVHEVIGTFKNR